MVRLAFLGRLVTAAGAILLHDPVPLTEYYDLTLKDYKGLAWKDITPENAAPMTRIKNLNNEQFKELVRAGYPFVVDDCVKPDAALLDFPCSEYGKRWPKEHMRAEYTPGQKHIYLKESDWYTVQKPTAKAEKHLSRGKPLSGPYIWHVKDETEDRQTKRDLQKLFPVPYFLNESALNANEAIDSFEFWFVLENGGSQAHADAYCETTISMQLRGSKKWRLGAFPNITNAFQEHAFHDAKIYEDRHESFWRPEHEELVHAGSCVVFPMGYIHETYVGEGDGGSDGCSVASTFQFQEPQPIYQWKNFLARWGLSHYAREEPCLDRMHSYVYLGRQIKFGKTDSEEQMRSKCSATFGQLDADADGSITLGELEPHFHRLHGRWQPPWTEGRTNELVAKAALEKVKWMTEDAVLFHDDNKDGKISLEEFQISVLKFEAVRRRNMHIKRTKNKKQLLEKEKAWIREHLCTSDDCETLKQLDVDYQQRKKGRKKRDPSSEL